MDDDAIFLLKYNTMFLEKHKGSLSVVGLLFDHYR